MAWIGFGIIAVFLILIISKRLSVITGLVLIPILGAMLAGIAWNDLGKMMLDGLKQVAPTGIMLSFAVLYFATMLDVGLFNPLTRWILRHVQGDPVKILLGTAVLTMLVHLDGDGTATFMIVISAFLALYKQVGIRMRYLAGIVALSVGPVHLVPWSGTSARAISTFKTEANVLFNPNLPALFAGLLWVLCVAYFWGQKERKRLGAQAITAPEAELSQQTNPLFWINALLTISLITGLMLHVLPAPVLFVLGSCLAMLINFPRLADQQALMKRHGSNIFFVSSMIFAAGIFSGILTGSGMIDAMSEQMLAWIPSGKGNWLPVLTAITSMPASMLFPPDAYYFGVLPVIANSASHLGIESMEIGRAALLGQMTVGFPLSPLTASTFLLIQLTDIDLGEHQKTTFFWAWGTSIVMTLVAILSGSIHI